MTRDLLLGVDAGTSVIKSVAFSLAGEQIAVAARPNVYETLGGGQVEQDMARTWADCAATLRELGERVPNLARRAAALGVTAQGDGSWLIDAAGEPVGGGLLWLDSRAASLVSDYVRSDAYPRPLCSHRLGPQRVHGFGAIGVDEALATRAHRPRRHLLSLQGLAVFQADRRARNRSLRGKFHLRQLPHPKIRALKFSKAWESPTARACCRR